MNQVDVDLALKKQRLQMRSAELRRRMRAHAAATAPVFAAADLLRDGARWLREHPLWPLLALAVMLAVRPRGAWRWARRGFALWRLGRRMLSWLSRPPSQSRDGETVPRTQ